MKYTEEQLAKLASTLRNMPTIAKKTPELSKSEAVHFLAKDIIALQRRGYSLEQVSEALHGGGLDILTSTLKSYLVRAKAAQKAPKKDAPKAVKSTPVISKKTVESPVKATFTTRSDSTDI